MKKLIFTQSFILAFGTAFSWYTVFTEFQGFYTNEGTIFKIADCIEPNPVTTPCFYGAIAFAVALVMSLIIMNRKEIARFISLQKNLLVLLIAGTVFAWSNFGFEISKYLTTPRGGYVGCSGAANPFLTACFIGSVIFTLALITAVLTNRKVKKEQTPPATPMV